MDPKKKKKKEKYTIWETFSNSQSLKITVPYRIHVL